ncbi:MAG: site-specific integrase [Methyloceanibacter sp.]
MAKRVRDNDLENRTNRAKLEARGKPYYKAIGPRVHVGYRKGAEARKWVARIYAGGGKYVVETIADADDLVDADGIRVLDFWQAQAKARELAESSPSTDGAPAGPYTVSMAIADYLEHMQGRATHRDTELRLTAFVPDALAAMPVAALTKGDLVRWHRSLAKTPPRIRTAKGAEQVHRNVDMTDPEVLRARQNSANRVLAQLRAALNLALNEERVASGKAWARMPRFKGVNSARVRYLSIAEAKRLINACDPDFRALVQAALQTGCRYGELARLRVADFNPDSRTVLIRTSKSGKPRHVQLTEEGAEFFAQLTLGKNGDDLLMGREWRPSDQGRPMRAACDRARIIPPISFHGLRHTWASLSVMGGMPLMVVARNLGHSSTSMVEQHYGHLSPSYVAAEIDAHAPRFGIGEYGNVKAIR